MCNGSHRLMHLDTWSPAGSAVAEGHGTFQRVGPHWRKWVTRKRPGCVIGWPHFLFSCFLSVDAM